MNAFIIIAIWITLIACKALGAEFLMDVSWWLVAFSPVVIIAALFLGGIAFAILLVVGGGALALALLVICAPFWATYEGFRYLSRRRLRR